MPNRSFEIAVRYLYTVFYKGAGEGLLQERPRLVDLVFGPERILSDRDGLVDEVASLKKELAQTRLVLHGMEYYAAGHQHQTMAL